MATQLTKEAEGEGASVAPFVWNPPIELGFGGPNVVYAPDTGLGGFDMLGMLKDQLSHFWNVPLIHWPTLVFGSVGSAYIFLKKADKTLKSYLAFGEIFENRRKVRGRQWRLDCTVSRREIRPLFAPDLCNEKALIDQGHNRTS